MAREPIDLGGSTHKKNSSKSQPTMKGKPVRRSIMDEDTDYDDDDDEEDDDDEVVQKAKSAGGSNHLIFIIVGVLVVVVVVIVFLLTCVGKSNGSSGTGTEEEMSTSEGGGSADGQVQEGPVQVLDANGNLVTQNTTTVPEVTDDDLAREVGVGTQDFTQDTTMDTSSSVVDGDEYVKDIYGLTVRVDYTVDKILDTTDFVSYTKKRGTWGGGMELYWLDCNYKGAKYVVQVPFKYYKELDDTGVVPVKMEVLQIAGETEGENRTIVSYMCLDEQTLETVMQSQGREGEYSVR